MWFEKYNIYLTVLLWLCNKWGNYNLLFFPKTIKHESFASLSIIHVKDLAVGPEDNKVKNNLKFPGEK